MSELVKSNEGDLGASGGFGWGSSVHGDLSELSELGKSTKGVK